MTSLPVHRLDPVLSRFFVKDFVVDRGLGCVYALLADFLSIFVGESLTYVSESANLTFKNRIEK